MDNNINVYLRQDNQGDQEILNLVHLAFEERKTQGLDFTCIHYTLDDIRKKAEGALVFLAYHECELVGCIFFHTYTKKKKYGYIEVVSVHPDYKGMGIASIIFSEIIKKAEELQLEYIGSDTASTAKSSVKWHLKNGFRIVKLQSSRKSNYYSYVFRNQLKSPSIWNSTIWTRTRFFLSSVKCKMMKDQYGRYTFFGKIVGKVKRVFSH